jgi:hypothetical protein
MPGLEVARPVHLLGIALLAFVAYANALTNGFALDDAYLITDNDRITSLANIPSLFATDLFDGALPAVRYYRPLVSTSFALEYAVAGAEPFVFHLGNVAIHALVCGLIYWLVLTLFAQPVMALVTAALFAVHPVHTEAVTAVSGRGDLLSSLFLLAAAVFYSWTPGRPPVARQVAAATCYALALLSKESAALGLAIFVLIALVRLEERRGFFSDTHRVLRQQAGFLLWCLFLTGLYFGVRQVVAAGDGSVSALQFMGHPENQGAPLALKLATCGRLLGEYYRLLLFPVGLSADYSYNQIPLAPSLLDGKAFAALLVTAGMVALAVRNRERHPVVSFALLFLVVGTLPLACLLPFFRIVLAERYLYLPSLGFCLLVGAGVAALWARRVPRHGALMVASLLLALAMLGTVQRNRDWRDDEALFAATVATSPQSSKAQANRAITLFRKAEAHRMEGAMDEARARFLEACDHYQHSIDIEPGAAPVRMQHGVCLARVGHYARAEEEFQTAAELGSAEAWLFFYRAFVDEARLHAAQTPDQARALHRKARAVVDERIRPLVSPQDLDKFVAELAELERQLAP